MTLDEVYRHYLDAKNQRIILSFMGVVTQEIMLEYGRIIQHQTGLTPNNRLQLFSVFVELTQNILRYSDERTCDHAGRPAGVGIVVVGETAEGFQVAAGNMIAREKVARLKMHLDEIQPMDKEALKVRYKEQRRRPAAPDALGAGLGLLDLARKACEPLHYHFSPIDQDREFFIILVNLLRQPIDPSQS